MRGFPGFTHLHYIAILCLLLIFLHGCAGQFLQAVPASDIEAETAASVFREYMETFWKECDKSLDVEMDAEIAVAGLFRDHSAKLTGYLQALEPGFIKFVALNPLGQPVLVFISDGRTFKSMNILEGRAFTGSVESQTFRKFFPNGLVPASSYYWLAGKVEPGEMRILSVRRAGARDAYWLQVRHEFYEHESMILFDPLAPVVHRHVVTGDNGKTLVDFTYDYPAAKTETERTSADSMSLSERACTPPSGITVISNAGRDKRIEISLHSFLLGSDLSPADFELEIPPTLELHTVN